jgi:uncharacterized protein
MNAIADTGWIVAFRHGRDEHHAWAKRIAEVITLPILTCEAVLAEAGFRLENTRAVMQMLESGMFKVTFRLDEHQEQVAVLARTYQDRNPDLADLCLIRMSEIFSRHTVLTVDHEDFLVYRRNRSEFIPFLSPQSQPDSLSAAAKKRRNRG